MGSRERLNLEKRRASNRRRNRNVLIPLFLATGTTLLLVFILSVVNSNLTANGDSAIIFTSFAASSFIIFMMPNSSSSNTGKFILSYLIGGIVGELGYLSLPYIGLFSAVAAVLFFTSLLLFKTNNMHPPAMGAALAFVIFHVSYAGLLVLASGIIVLSAIKICAEKLGLEP
ncbi:MAG: HPP family protein [Candidatus Micrarchaeota archaeon]|nr:HPP family protein [Candidatus Micrarchaeota archaeon]MDE1847772.1 HPP family protein [Candidatus Micrarchaeota archaeon]MDE1864210.1 HPP family protein [Candidatus Micrarchaeota archaeon]